MVTTGGEPVRPSGDFSIILANASSQGRVLLHWADLCSNYVLPLLQPLRFNGHHIFFGSNVHFQIDCYTISSQVWRSRFFLEREFGKCIY